MNEVDQISLANQLFHLIIGDTKPNYIAHSVQELNPLILGVMQWAQNQGWSENEMAQGFNDNFCSYYTGIVAIRYRCVFAWLRRACNDEDSNAIDRIISHFLYTPDNGLVNYEKIYPLINGDFPIGRFNSGITMNNNAEWLMSCFDHDLQERTGYVPTPEMRAFFISRLRGLFVALDDIPVFRKEGCAWWIGWIVAGCIVAMLFRMIF